MNTPDNKRKKESCEKLQKTFIELLQKKELNEIKVSDICKKAGLNRSTFYSNYIDIYDLADKIKENMFDEILSLYPEEIEAKKHSYDFLKLFKHIKENQIFYKTYFKLVYDENNELIKTMVKNSGYEKYYSDKNKAYYHITFFMFGLNAVIKKWLYFGCKESPEEIYDIIKEEYKIKKVD